MSAEPKPDFSEFADFADTIRKQRLRSEQVVRRALNRAKAHYPVPLFAPAAHVVTTPDTRSLRGLAGNAAVEGWNVKQVVWLSDAHSGRSRVGCEQPIALYWNFTEETDEDLF